jgi:hypothetical protein
MRLGDYLSPEEEAKKKVEEDKKKAKDVLY